MKRRLFQALCVLLVFCVCVSLTACGSRNVGGIGVLDLDDEGSGGIGALGGSADGDAPSSEPTQTPQSAPDEPSEDAPAAPASSEPSGFETEMYTCEMFTVMIPKGWKVDSDVVDVGNDMERIYLFVRDPADSRNMFFYILAMEPFYLSEEGKNAWLPYMPDYFRYAPVLADPTAEEILRIWPSVYTFMQAENGPLLPFFSNYALSEVLESGPLESTADGARNSYALGKVEIPSAGPYYMFFQSSLQLMDAPAGIDSSAKYYTSYGNLGIVLSTEAPASDLDALKVCLQSLNLDGFANRK
jgi:hypothetical protein